MIRLDISISLINNTASHQELIGHLEEQIFPPLTTNSKFDHISLLEHNNSKFNTKFDFSPEIRSIKECPDILFMKTDKGNTTLAMAKSDYNNKMIRLLEDQSQFKVMYFEYTG